MKLLGGVLCSLVVAYSAYAQTVTDNDLRSAKRLFERITGVKVASNHPSLKTMANLLAEGKHVQAAKVATESSEFLNVQVKNFSLKMSNKDDSIKVPFNDFSAIVAGIIRDDKDFRDVLVGDYYYDTVDPTNTNDADQRNRFFNQNSYTAVETNMMDLKSALVFKSRQQLVRSAKDTSLLQRELNYNVVGLAEHPQPAGVLTTRTFAERNLSGGTNRRAVEFTLNKFLCVSIAEAADAKASDQMVGRDVERFPGGDYLKYETTCKACHAVLDGMRPAFGKLDYANFSNAAATGVFSQMHGGFFISQKVNEDYVNYVNTIVNPQLAPVISDLEANQESSDYYTVRYNFLISRGTTDANAKSALAGVLNTIRDPAVLSAQTAACRTANASDISDIRANITLAANVSLYTQTCLNHLKNTALSTAEQEEKFLLCDLNNRKENSFLYLKYQASLVSANTASAEQTRLLNKFLQKNRNTDINILIPYLQAKEQSMLFARNAFDTTTGIATKLNKGSYPYGFVVKSDDFVNNANLGSKATFFGWRGVNKNGGKGIKDYARMISDSRRFSQCMAKKVFENVCMKKLDSSRYSTLVRLGDRFEALNYNMKNLFQEIAVDSACGILKEK